MRILAYCPLVSWVISGGLADLASAVALSGPGCSSGLCGRCFSVRAGVTVVVAGLLGLGVLAFVRFAVVLGVVLDGLAFALLLFECCSAVHMLSRYSCNMLHTPPPF
jgi:hypothetical protein